MNRYLVGLLALATALGANATPKKLLAELASDRQPGAPSAHTPLGHKETGCTNVHEDFEHCATPDHGRAAMLQTASKGKPSMKTVAGHYYLEGVREVGAELLLKQDGRFEYGISYGGVDKQAAGSWVLVGKQLSLTTDTKPAAAFTGASESASVPADYAKPGAPAVALVVAIQSSALGLVWSRVEISAEFANGKMRSGQTGRNGMLGFDDRAEPEWQGLAIRRVGVAYPSYGVAQVWFPVQAGSRLLTVEFDPGNLLEPAFATLQLDLERLDEDAASLRVQAEGAAAWRYVRR